MSNQEFADTPSSRVVDFAADERGALAIEYIVVTMVGLMVAAALGGLGLLLVDAFGRSLKVLYSEFP